MKPQIRISVALAALIVNFVLVGMGFVPDALGHELNVNGTLQECDIQFSANLTQSAFERFTREGGDIVMYKNTGTTVLAPGRTELSVSYMSSPIDQHADAWNETFHHPDGDHPLGDAIAVPAVYGRIGLGKRMDFGAYFTMNPKASYRFTGAGLKVDLPWDSGALPDLAASMDYGLLFGPDDVTVHSLGGALHTSGTWKAITAYGSAGVTWAHAEERSPLVELQNANTTSPYLGVGLSPQLWNVLQIDLRARFASVNTFEVKFGHAF